MKRLEPIVVKRIRDSLDLKTEIEVLTDGELASQLTQYVWTRALLYTREGILIDETIKRLRRADIQRRWNERRTRRAKG